MNKAHVPYDGDCAFCCKSIRLLQKLDWLRKLDYIRARTTIPNAEYFIQEAATKSSMSGDIYQVRCPGSAVNECQRWLMNELQRLRTTPARQR